MPCLLISPMRVSKPTCRADYLERQFSIRPIADQYFHDLARFHIDSNPESDLMVIRDGNVSVTEIDIRHLGQ
jgi:hypothetical protein